MHTTDRLLVAGEAETAAVREGILSVAIDWDSVRDIQSGMWDLFPDQRRVLSGLADYGEEGMGIIRLQGHDQPYLRQPDEALFLTAAALGVKGRRDNSGSVYKRMTKKAKIIEDQAPVLELPIDDWGHVRLGAGYIVARGLAEAAGMIEPMRPRQRRAKGEDLVRVPLGTLHQRFPNPLFVVHGTLALTEEPDDL